MKIRYGTFFSKVNLKKGGKLQPVVKWFSRHFYSGHVVHKGFFLEETIYLYYGRASGYNQSSYAFSLMSSLIILLVEKEVARNR